MIFKKGEILLRDVVFIMLIMSSILVFASTFVTEMATNYGDNQMISEYSLSNISMTKDSGLFKNLKSDVNNISGELQAEEEGTGLWSLITGTKDIVVNIIYTFLTAPNRVGDLTYDVLVDIDVPAGIAETIKWTIVIGLWIIVIFAIVTAFLQGAKV